MIRLNVKSTDVQNFDVAISLNHHEMAVKNLMIFFFVTLRDLRVIEFKIIII